MDMTAILNKERHFWDQVENYEITCLSETCLEGKYNDKIKEKITSNYKWFGIHAEKNIKKEQQRVESSTNRNGEKLQLSCIHTKCVLWCRNLGRKRYYQ